MRWSPGFFFYILAFLHAWAFPAHSRPVVLINEIYYDHPGVDTGLEYVELCNAGPDKVDLYLYTLEFVDGSTGHPRVLWRGEAGFVLRPGGLFLVGGGDVDGAEGALQGSIENGPDAVRLISGTGIEDLVGYGETIYCEGEPVPDAPPGVSLARKPDGRDTDDNFSDFVHAAPTPGLPNFYDRDLEIIPCEAPLPCAGSPFEARVLLVCRGLEPFVGTVRVSASLDGPAAAREIEVCLQPSDAVEVGLEVSCAPPGCFALGMSIESIADENRLNDTAGVMICSSPGGLVTNEIMYRPLEGGSEWIEVMNRGAEAVSLRDWLMSDATGTRRLISGEDIWIDPGGFVILAQDSLLFTRDHPLCTVAVVRPEGGWPWLNDTSGGAFADVVSLHDPRGGIVERVGYPDLVEDERGRSVERFSPDACSSIPGGLWHRSSAATGSTPGSHNSGLVPGEARPGRVEAVPNPFSPERDGSVVIWGEALVGETGLSVRVFDIDGVEVARLFGEEGGARVFSCSWDGRSKGGGESPTGLYICVVEFVSVGGGVCRRVKRCVALYR